MTNQLFLLKFSI